MNAEKIAKIWAKEDPSPDQPVAWVVRMARALLVAVEALDTIVLTTDEGHYFGDIAREALLKIRGEKT